MKKVVISCLLSSFFVLSFNSTPGSSFWAGLGIGTAATTIAHAAAKPSRTHTTRYIEINNCSSIHCTQLKRHVELLEAKNAELESENLELIEENESLLDSIESKNYKIKEQKQKLKKRKRELASLQNDYKRLEKKLKKLEKTTSYSEEL